MCVMMVYVIRVCVSVIRVCVCVFIRVCHVGVCVMRECVLVCD